MKCNRCGTENEKDANFCKNCGNNLKKDYALVYILICIFCELLGFCFNIPWLFWIGVIDIITAKIRCPRNLIIQILFWATIISLILVFIYMCWIIWMCNNSVSSCLGG